MVAMKIPVSRQPSGLTLSGLGNDEDYKEIDQEQYQDAPQQGPGADWRSNGIGHRYSLAHRIFMSCMKRSVEDAHDWIAASLLLGGRLIRPNQR